MKRVLLGAASVSLLAALTMPASAADLRRPTYTKAPPVTPVEQVYDWTGFYVGGHLGGAFTGDNNLASSDGRFLGGVQLGADYQFAPNWVVGVEGQYSWLGANNSGVAFPGGVASLDNRGLGSATGRFGYTWGPGLLYVKGGYAFADSAINVAVAGLPAPFVATGDHRNGWTVGGGLEYMFAPNWSGKVEYQYYKFDNVNFAAGPAPLVGTSFRDDEHTVKAGINYRFNWGGPPVPKY